MLGLWVDDLIEGLILLMNSDDSFTGPINLGNPNEMQIRILAEKIIEMTNSSSVIEFEPLPEDGPSLSSRLLCCNKTNATNDDESEQQKTEF